MTDYEWIREASPAWDADKARIVGGAPAGVFDEIYRKLTVGALAPGTWWRVVKSDRIVGYGWMDVVWGDAEILVATAPNARGKGAGSFALARLGEEAAAQGLNYVYNVVRHTHPQAPELTRFLHKNGFKPAEDGRLSKRAG